MPAIQIQSMLELGAGVFLRAPMAVARGDDGKKFEKDPECSPSIWWF
jgi:hypothetical protein